MKPLPSYETALKEVFSHLPPLRVERIPLREAAARVLASDVNADMDLPPFDKAIMDGYAVCSADLANSPQTLGIAGEIAAGMVPEISLKPGEAARVMTGAPIPAGADAVQRVEKTRLRGPASVEVLEPVKRGHFVALRGSEVKSGDTVLRRGDVLWESRIGVLAAFGKTEVDVFAQPAVVVLPTGDEIVEAGQQPGPGEIRNSSSEMLAALCRNVSNQVSIHQGIGDDPDVTRRLISDLIEPDVLILTGGVSMGSRDYVHQVLAQAGVRIILHKAAIKPGKPILFGRRGKQMIFGLPGNPVSSFVSFELFVRPAIRKVTGFSKPHLQRCTAVLTRRVSQNPGRQFFKPVSLSRRMSGEGAGFSANPIETAGSADLCAFAAANGLMVVPADATEIEAGSEVEVIMLGAFFWEGYDNEADPR